MTRRKSHTPFQRVAILLLATLGSSSCSTVNSALSAPGKILRGIAPGDDPSVLDLDQLSLRLMRFGDLSAFRMIQATQAFAAAVGTPEARLQALAWQVDSTRAFWRLASGPQPYEGLFSSIAVVTALRHAHESHWLPKWGEADRLVLDAILQIESDAWALAVSAIGAERSGQARDLIDNWFERNEDSAIGDLIVFPALGDILQTRQRGDDPGGLLGLITLDPLAGLEPAVAEVEQSRRMAERALYLLQHLPSLLSAQVELTGLRSAQSQEVQKALGSWERFSAASASLAATAEALPVTFAAEREALFAQLSHEVTAQREGLLRDLESAREPLNEILRQTQGTAEAGREMSLALTATLEAGLALSRAIEDLRRPASPPAGTVADAGAGEAWPARRPFDITEYTAAAESLARTARALTETIASLDRSLPQLQLAVNEALAHGDRTVDHAFRRALQLLLAALVGGAITVLVVRRITLRWSAKPERAGPG